MSQKTFTPAGIVTILEALHQKAPEMARAYAALNDLQGFVRTQEEAFRDGLLVVISALTETFQEIEKEQKEI